MSGWAICEADEAEVVRNNLADQGILYSNRLSGLTVMSRRFTVASLDVRGHEWDM